MKIRKIILPSFTYSQVCNNSDGTIASPTEVLKQNVCAAIE
jgi:hypothetical protein